MIKTTQDLNSNWFAVPEKENCRNKKDYYLSFDEENCVKTDIPATVKDLFPKASTAIWYYKRFNCDLTPDKDHRIYLEFQKVISLCEAWVNGIYVGKHLHSEEKFYFDVTDALKEGENLVALRVYGPVWGKDGEEGISMQTMPNFAQVYAYYTVIPLTGIYEKVSLVKKPLCSVKDLYINPDVKSKSVTVELTLENKSSQNESIEADFEIYDKGSLISSLSKAFSVKGEGRLTESVTLEMEDIRLWSPDDPYLYSINVSVKTKSTKETKQKRFGFKSLYIEDGWFILNGKRIFLTCAHSIEGKDAVVHAKTMGFKALRYLSAMPSEELLDFCDEIGMLVYEECAAAWGMQDYPDMPRHMSEYHDNMMCRDRSHVCVGIWGIFNEQAGPNKKMKSRRLSDTSKVFDFAVSYLPQMRRLDDTRLILLSSGRWDARADIGSFSNPGSKLWNCGWGKESPDFKNLEFEKAHRDIDPYIEGLGDNHVYPTVPIQNKVRDFIRTIGENTKPVFLSEYGVGAQFELYDLFIEQKKKSHKDHPSLSYYSIQIERMEQWIKKYSLEKIYPTPRDFLMASICSLSRQRRESIDPIRANPKLCGYSMTSFTISNEGVYYRSDALIPGIADALRDSFAPLKWSVFMDQTQLYSNTPFEVEAVLCNEDLLPAGEYSALLSVSGSKGVVFTKEYCFNYPDNKPLAASVIKDTLPGLPADKYVLSLHLKGEKQPTCSNKSFCVHELSKLPPLNGSFYIFGEAGAVKDLLLKHEMKLSPSAKKADVIIVGILPSDPFQRKEILDLAFQGKKTLVLDHGFWESANTSTQGFMQSVEYSSQGTDELAKIFGSCIYVRNWLYHLDSYVADNRIFEGLCNAGLLDMDEFRLVYPDRYLTETEAPKKTFCASFGSGLFAKDNCISALTMGEFDFGKGSVTVSTFKLIENALKDPVADRLIYNLLKYLT